MKKDYLNKGAGINLLTGEDEGSSRPEEAEERSGLVAAESRRHRSFVSLFRDENGLR